VIDTGLYSLWFECITHFMISNIHRLFSETQVLILNFLRLTCESRKHIQFLEYSKNVITSKVV